MKDEEGELGDGDSEKATPQFHWWVRSEPLRARCQRASGLVRNTNCEEGRATKESKIREITWRRRTCRGSFTTDERAATQSNALLRRLRRGDPEYRGDFVASRDQVSAVSSDIGAASHFPLLHHLLSIAIGRV